MKTKESGMPEEIMWEKFFDVETILNKLEENSESDKLVDFGFGYRTFTIPSSRKIKGIVYAFDIENSLTKELESKLKIDNIENVVFFNRDFIKEGTVLQNEEVGFVMLFNILHAEQSTDILKETFRILKKNSKVGVIHWN